MFTILLTTFTILIYSTYSQTQSYNLNVNLSSHLGDSSNQLIPVAVNVLPDGTTLIACNALDTDTSMYTFSDSSIVSNINFISLDDFTGSSSSNSTTSSFDNTQSLIIAIERANSGNSNEYTITSILGLGSNNIDDIASNNNYHIVAVGSFGIIGIIYDNCNNIFDIKFVDNNDTYTSNCDNSYDCKVDIGINDNIFVGYFGKANDDSGWLTQVFNWIEGDNNDNSNDRNEIIWSQTLSKTNMEDVAIDTDNSLYFRIGYQQLTDNLQVTYIFATDYTGASENDYRLYGWNDANELSDDGSDTRGTAVQVTSANSLWILGRADGGTSIFSHLPDDLSSNANNIGYDSYTQTFNTGSSAQTYYALISSSNATHERGQFMLNRLSSNSGNTLRPVAIDADENDNKVYIAQQGACCAQGRDNMTINGMKTGGYAGSDGLLCISNYDLNSRLYWTVFTKYDENNNYKSNSVDVATNNGVTAFVGYVQEGGSIIEVNSFDGTSPHSSDNSGFIVIIDNYYGTENSGACGANGDSNDSGDGISWKTTVVSVWLTALFSVMNF